MPTIVSIAFTVIAIAVIFFLAWFVTRFVASRGGAGAPGKNVRVLERTPVTKDSCVMLLKAAGRYLVVGVTNGSMTVLRELSPDEVDLPAEPPQPESFAQAMKQAVDSALPEGRIKKAFDDLAKKGGALRWNKK